MRGDGCHVSDIEPGIEHAGSRMGGIGWEGFAAGSSSQQWYCALGAIEFAGMRGAAWLGEDSALL